MKNNIVTLIRKNALKNAIEHNGKALVKPVISRVLGEKPELKVKIKAIIERWEKKLTKRPEYDDARDIFNQLNSLKLRTKEELAVIFERGIVPGSCKYCPA